MSANRLNLLLSASDPLPEDGLIAVFEPQAHSDLSALPQTRVRIVTRLRPVHEAWSARGYTCEDPSRDGVGAAVVFLPRGRDHARGLVAQAVAAVSGGPVLIDGQKTNGIDAIYKALRPRGECMQALSKAHGKIFVLRADPDDLADWAIGAPSLNRDGFHTLPGVFSADGVDPASALLAKALPASLGAQVADLGAGWGYLSLSALTRDLSEIHLVEADRAALECARLNITDMRARFHWADATGFASERVFDSVIMNPPFHTGRAAEPQLGQAFIATAARILKPGGQLWLVANRHLPYEAALQAGFSSVSEVGGDRSFKIIQARGPRKTPRRGR